VQKLFRFTDSVVFSFDGDAAGRRAALRALEASLPHASDTRTIRFLFLPPEHDPDSYVREFGAEAFERCVGDAVPLSRQLLDSAAAGCDLDTAEGRAKLVAQAKPWIAQLPPGLLRGQIVDLLAERARVVPDELRRSLTAGRPAAQTAAPRPANVASVPSSPLAGPRPLRPTPSRRPLATMATSLDRAVWLVFQRADLWEQLEADVQHLLTEQPSPHGEFFGWLDRLVHEQGALAPSALATELQASVNADALLPLFGRIREFHDVPVGDGARQELEVIIDRLRLGVTQTELEFLAGSPDLSDASKARQRDLMLRQRQLKERLARSPTVGG
jgi:DNA primase